MSSIYNGWSYFETWNANLWIDNDWRLSERIALITCDFFSSFEDLDKITGLVAERINDLFLDFMPDIEPGFFSDVMNASFREVNFWEIARYYVEAEAETLASFQGK